MGTYEFLLIKPNRCWSRCKNNLKIIKLVYRNGSLSISYVIYTGIYFSKIITRLTLASSLVLYIFYSPDRWFNYIHGIC